MKKIFSIILMMISLQQIFAQANQFNLSGLWHFQQGDNLQWANNTDKSEWSKQPVPAWDWGNEYAGYAWYSKDIVLPDQEIYYFNLGQVDDDCEVYFNGQKLQLYLHPTSPELQDTALSSRWKRYRGYYIPKELIRSKENNQINIRVWNTLGAQGGIRNGNIFVSKTVFYNQLPIALSGNWLQQDNSYLISFLDNKVIYKNKVWDYHQISNKGELIQIQLKDKNLESTQLFVKRATDTNFLIGPTEDNLQSCSLFENERPLQKTKTQNLYQQEIPLQGKALYTGYIKDFSNRNGQEGILEYFNGRSISEKLVYIESDGTFQMSLDFDKPTKASLRLPGINTAVPVYLAPEKSVFQFIDLAEFKIYVTQEFYNRKRLTMTMGDLALENNLYKYMNWLNAVESPNLEVWNKFLNTAKAIEAQQEVSDVEINQIASFIAESYPLYLDQEALQEAKKWSQKTLLSSPDSHLYNSTLNAILQLSGEKMEGLEHLIKALELANKENNSAFSNQYKADIKKYVSTILEED